VIKRHQDLIAHLWDEVGPAAKSRTQHSQPGPEKETGQPGKLDLHPRFSQGVDIVDHLGHGHAVDPPVCCLIDAADQFGKIFKHT
jgi:hypothetical protein